MKEGNFSALIKTLLFITTIYFFSFSLYSDSLRQESFDQSIIEQSQENHSGIANSPIYDANNSFVDLNRDLYKDRILVSSVVGTTALSTGSASQNNILGTVGGIAYSDIASFKIPQDIRGIWEGADRFIFIEQVDDSTEPEIVIILKDFYGWYYDRVAEGENYSNMYPRSRNSATSTEANHITINVSQIEKSNDTIKKAADNAFELTLNYSKHQKSIVPLLVYKDNVYLDFLMQDKNNSSFYKGVALSQGITASEQRVSENIYCYLLDDNLLYPIRYWITDMEFSSRNVRLVYGDKVFDIPAHITSAGHNYACVPGRRNIVRNVMDPIQLDDSYVFTDDKSIMMKDPKPYLTRVIGKDDFEQLMEIVNEANSRRKPALHQLFPDSEVDFYWDIIDLIEKDNKLIQEVRKRQRAFGPRGKDSGK